MLLASENKGLELKGNLSKHWLCSSLIPYFLTSKLIQVCSISGSQSKGKNSWRWFTHKWNAQNQSGYLSLLPFFLCIWILSLYFPPFLLSLLSSVGAAVSRVVPLEMPAVLNEINRTGSSVGISSVWSLRDLILVFFYSQKSKLKITLLLPNRHLPLLSRKWKGVSPATLMDSIDQGMVNDLWFRQHLSIYEISKVFIKCWLDNMPCCIQNIPVKSQVCESMPHIVKVGIDMDGW